MINNKNLSGSWLLQNAVYIINNKTNKVFKNKLSLFSSKMSKNINQLYQTNNLHRYRVNMQNHGSTLILNQKILPDKNISISIEELDVSTFKLSYSAKKSNLIYEEYMYTITNNLIFSYSILKDKRYNKYLGIIMGSYIKLKD